MEGLAWVFSSQARRPVYGFALVLLVWTDGQLRSPVGLRLWHHGGPSQYGLALELLSSARHRLHGRPASVLFDAWYPSHALLKRIRDDGWYCVCRLKQHRRCKHQPLRSYRRHPSGAETGQRTGGLNSLVVSYSAQYFATTRLTLPAAEVRRLYRIRTQIAEVIRVCKDHLGLTGCQARSARAQLHHMASCLTAFCVLERERHARGLSIYTRKRALSCNGRSIRLPALERLRSTA
jgi:Transposase DDE domain